MKAIALVFSAAIALIPATAAVQAQERLSDTQLIETLNVLDQSKTIDIVALRRQAVDSVAANRGPDASLREPLSQELDNLSQFTVEIQFRTGSAVIRPASFRTIGVIADSLLHPTLLEYKFLIVGHTDAVGDRKSNLTLSQKRADAVRDALVTTFGIVPSRIVAVGLGEEQLQNRKNPDAAANRRVQIVNVGRFR
ncbi:OmpA family protein [Bosea sp. BK604]|uniref:OmpA family protein n=1 Tax=Bosea sp. BK604 TaxID=2512180 RepID=UPI0010EE288B|nr:OmpA family protein [Bosea sp. BK604]TCR65482.1 outer membrane protein OmpA-like peptidoglycan-associated protein [Bosea sp. BK604]